MIPKRSVAQVILEVLGAEPDRKFSYEELYQRSCGECGRKLSKRDFQACLDILHASARRLILIEVDPEDRRRKRIRRAPPYDDADYAGILESRLRDFLTDLFRKDGWLIPIDAFPLTDKWLEVNRGLTPSQLVQKYAWWRKYTVQEAREILSIGKLNGPPVVRKFSRDRETLTKVQMEFREASIEVNVKEILAAWRERRAVNRENILAEIRKNQAALRKKWMNA